MTIFYWYSDLNKDTVAIVFWYYGFYIVGGFIFGNMLGVFAGTIVDNRKLVP